MQCKGQTVKQQQCKRYTKNPNQYCYHHQNQLRKVIKVNESKPIESADLEIYFESKESVQQIELSPKRTQSPKQIYELDAVFSNAPTQGSNPYRVLKSKKVSCLKKLHQAFNILKAPYK